MMHPQGYEERAVTGAEGECLATKEAFSPYLDGELSGVSMARIATHLESCTPCAYEFQVWRSMQSALGDLGPAKAPGRLQARLRIALAAERERGTYLSPLQRLAQRWRTSVAPLVPQFAGGFFAALLLLGGLVRICAPALAVQANDDNMAHLIGPHYLYSQVTPQIIETRHDIPILVEAKVDTRGRVYDFNILDGPADPAVRERIEQNLLASVFEPATVFGVPVDGHVMLTYTGVSVRG